MVKNKHFFSECMHLKKCLDFSKKCSSEIHSNGIHKFMLPLIFFLCKQLLVKFLYGLFHS